jgi:hypothetical protein
MFRYRMLKNGPTGWLKRILSFVCRVLLVCGVATLVTGLGFVMYTTVWLLRSVPGRATVVDLVPNVPGQSAVIDGGDGNVPYSARFKFKADDGKVYVATAGVATNPPSFEIGEEVRVRYLPTDPTSARLSYFWQLWLEPVLCAVLGVFFTGIGCLFLRRERRSSLLSSQSRPASASSLR